MLIKESLPQPLINLFVKEHFHFCDQSLNYNQEYWISIWPAVYKPLWTKPQHTEKRKSKYLEDKKEIFYLLSDNFPVGDNFDKQ